MSDLVQPTLGVKSRFKFLDVFSGSSPPEISVPDNNEITRLTVGRVKPLLDLHRLCARQAIMIPYEAWTSRIPLDSGVLVTDLYFLYF